MINFGSIRFLLLASALTLALPVMPAHAEDGLPEVEIDGSVLKDLGQMQSDRNLPPVQLKPPVMGAGEAIEEEASAALTAHENEVIEDLPVEEAKEYTPVFLSAPESDPEPETASIPEGAYSEPEQEIAQEPLASQPIFAVQETPVATAEPQPIIQPEPVMEVTSAPEPPPLPEPEPVFASAPPPEIAEQILSAPVSRPALAAGSKAGMVVSPVDMPAPVAPVIAQQAAPVAPPVITQAQIKSPALQKSPLKEMKKMRPVATFEVPLVMSNEAPKPPVVLAPASQAEIMPPKPMETNAAIQAPVAGPVTFPVTLKTRTENFDPAAVKTAMAPTPAPAPAPVILAPESAPVPKKKPEIVEQAPALQETAAVKMPVNAPVPKPRPAIQEASGEFVRKARESLVETYTEALPAQGKADSNRTLPAKRLSVADIGDDPLASQLVDMSPQDVAVALNKMAPAVGQPMAAEVKHVSKPRIVRIEGERLVRQSVKDKAEAEAAAAALLAKAESEKAPKTEEPEAKLEKVSMTTAAAALPVRNTEKPAEEAAEASNLYAIAFKPGETDVPEGHQAAEMVEALKGNTDLRIQIVAFASTDDGKEGTARRISLSRALAVRSWLVSQGIDATRMDVRALGMQGAGDKPDRVEMVLVNPKKG